MENLLNQLRNLTMDETDMVIAYCIHNSSQYSNCLTFDEWLEQKGSCSSDLNFKDIYNLYIKECLLTTEEDAREYFNNQMK